MPPHSDSDLKELILLVVRELCGIREQIEQHNKNNSILCRMEKMETNMALKLSELKGEVAGLRGQVVKIWTEQQAKYDALVVEFNTLKASLDNVELPADVEQDLVDFKGQLQAFDDSIPDTTPPLPPTP